MRFHEIRCRRDVRLPIALARGRGARTRPRAARSRSPFSRSRDPSVRVRVQLVRGRTRVAAQSRSQSPRMRAPGTIQLSPPLRRCLQVCPDTRETVESWSSSVRARRLRLLPRTPYAIGRDRVRRCEQSQRLRQEGKRARPSRGVDGPACEPRRLVAVSTHDGPGRPRKGATATRRESPPARARLPLRTGPARSPHSGRGSPALPLNPHEHTDRGRLAGVWLRPATSECAQRLASRAQKFG